MSRYVDVYVEYKNSKGKYADGKWHLLPLYRKREHQYEDLEQKEFEGSNQIVPVSIMSGQSMLYQQLYWMPDSVKYNIDRDEVSEELKLYTEVDKKLEPQFDSYPNEVEMLDVSALYRYARMEGDMEGWMTDVDWERVKKNDEPLGTVFTAEDLMNSDSAGTKEVLSVYHHRVWCDPEGSLVAAKELVNSLDALYRMFFWSSILDENANLRLIAITSF